MGRGRPQARGREEQLRMAERTPRGLPRSARCHSWRPRPHQLSPAEASHFQLLPVSRVRFPCSGRVTRSLLCTAWLLGRALPGTPGRSRPAVPLLRSVGAPEALPTRSETPLGRSRGRPVSGSVPRAGASLCAPHGSAAAGECPPSRASVSPSVKFGVGPAPLGPWHSGASTEHPHCPPF